MNTLRKALISAGLVGSTLVGGALGAALLNGTANAADSPSWDAKGSGPDIDEARTVLMVLSRVLARPQVVSLTSDQRARVEAARDRLAGIVGRGQVTPSERTWLVWTARVLMATVF